MSTAGEGINRFLDLPLACTADNMYLNKIIMGHDNIQKIIVPCISSLSCSLIFCAKIN